MSEKQYYIVADNQRKGPFSEADLVANGLQHDTLTWYAGMDGWLPARQVSDLAPLLKSVPPPLPAAAGLAPVAAGVSRRTPPRKA
jgi:hypothetical protein